MITTIPKRMEMVRGTMSQAEFARKLEINPNTLRSYEAGRALPNQAILERLCLEFNISPSWILLGHGDMRISKNTNSEDVNIHKYYSEMIDKLKKEIHKKDEMIEIGDMTIEKLKDTIKINDDCMDIIYNKIMDSVASDSNFILDSFHIHKKLLNLIEQVKNNKKIIEEDIEPIIKFVEIGIENTRTRIVLLSVLKKENKDK